MLGGLVRPPATSPTPSDARPAGPDLDPPRPRAPKVRSEGRSCLRRPPRLRGGPLKSSVGGRPRSFPRRNTRFWSLRPPAPCRRCGVVAVYPLIHTPESRRHESASLRHARTPEGRGEGYGERGPGRRGEGKPRGGPCEAERRRPGTTAEGQRRLERRRRRRRGKDSWTSEATSRDRRSQTSGGPGTGALSLDLLATWRLPSGR